MRNIEALLAKMHFSVSGSARAEMAAKLRELAGGDDTLAFDAFAAALKRDQAHADTEQDELVRAFRSVDPLDTGRASIMDVRRSLEITGVMGDSGDALMTPDDFASLIAGGQVSGDGDMMHYRPLIQHLMSNKPR
jgi:Ca2+-binding EF-hand superfamily protein